MAYDDCDIVFYMAYDDYDIVFYMAYDDCDIEPATQLIMTVI